MGTLMIDNSAETMRLLEQARAVPGVEVADLYGLYPDYDIDVPREQARVVESDAVHHEPMGRRRHRFPIRRPARHDRRCRAWCRHLLPFVNWRHRRPDYSEYHHS